MLAKTNKYRLNNYDLALIHYMPNDCMLVKPNNYNALSQFLLYYVSNDCMSFT